MYLPLRRGGNHIWEVEVIVSPGDVGCTFVGHSITRHRLALREPRYDCCPSKSICRIQIKKTSQADLLAFGEADGGRAELISLAKLGSGHTQRQEGKYIQSINNGSTRIRIKQFVFGASTHGDKGHFVRAHGLMPGSQI